jgi:hypothetical protein
MDIISIILLLAVFGAGYAFRGFIGKEVKAAGAEIKVVVADFKAEVAKLKADASADLKKL